MLEQMPKSGLRVDRIVWRYGPLVVFALRHTRSRYQLHQYLVSVEPTGKGPRVDLGLIPADALSPDGMASYLESWLRQSKLSPRGSEQTSNLRRAIRTGLKEIVKRIGSEEQVPTSLSFAVRLARLPDSGTLHLTVASSRSKEHLGLGPEDNGGNVLICWFDNHGAHRFTQGYFNVHQAGSGPARLYLQLGKSQFRDDARRLIFIIGSPAGSGLQCIVAPFESNVGRDAIAGLSLRESSRATTYGSWTLSVQRQLLNYLAPPVDMPGAWPEAVREQVAELSTIESPAIAGRLPRISQSLIPVPTEHQNYDEVFMQWLEEDERVARVASALNQGRFIEQTVWLDLKPIARRESVLLSQRAARREHALVSHCEQILNVVGIPSRAYLRIRSKQIVDLAVTSPDDKDAPLAIIDCRWSLRSGAHLPFGVRSAMPQYLLVVEVALSDQDWRRLRRGRVRLVSPRLEGTNSNDRRPDLLSLNEMIDALRKLAATSP